MVNLKITVTGKVQGVWFRAKTKEKADELKLSGFVKNQDDGSVYIEVSGRKEIVYKLISWLQDGSDLSIVEEVCVEKNMFSYDKGFLIKR